MLAQNKFKTEFRSLSLTKPITQNEHATENFKELTEERTEFSRKFISDEGTHKVEVSKTPLCYRKNGVLLPIESRPSFNDNRWGANNQPFPVHLNLNGLLTVEFEKGEELTLFSNSTLNGKKINFKNIIEEEASFYASSDCLRKKINFIAGGVKYSYIVDSINFSGDFELKETLILPKGYSLLKKNAGSYLEILDEEDHVKGVFGEVLCFDQNYDVFQGKYEIEQTDNHFKVSIRVPQTWLNNSRAFPIIIDPIVAGVPSTWGGGNMPSCFMPQYNADSLAVTIPAGITLTGLYVSSSFYADPFTPATMGMGSMYFSTDCASSQYFTITGALENSPGTAYLDSFNLLNPLSCCFPKSCSDTSIYVRFHLGRDALGAGCNTSYIRYDLFTQWPFKVVIYGKTPETYGNEWYIPQDPICSNNCEFTATGYARYGVPPYTFMHPWSQDTIVAGTNSGCNLGSTNNIFTLINPNCPVYCDSTFNELEVPTPVIIDACGNSVSDIPIKTKPVIPTAQPNVQYDSTICDGDNLYVLLEPCLNNSIINYYGNGYSGQDSISHILALSGDSLVTVNYSVYANSSGCISDTLVLPVYVIPNPSSSFVPSENPGVIETQVNFENTSTSFVGPMNSFEWFIDNAMESSSENFNYTFSVPGEYPLCLISTDMYGCVDTLCVPFLVVPAEITNINVITPNGDDINDVLSFEYLEFYNNNSLKVFNRWGNLVFSKENYNNDWDGSGLEDGVYFYILKITDTETQYSSYFHIIR